MKIRFCSGITKPGFLLVHFEPPSFFSVRSRSLSDGNLINPKKRPGIGLRLQCAIANRRFSSRPVDSPRRERSRSSSGRDKDKPRESQSLYSRPSLLEMNKEKADNRAKVYEFLRGIGIVPDELDGLELPVTADVMKERVDFFHKLGLTIEDINNCPLVLGCSVKTNMVPVLERYVLKFRLEGTMSTSVAYLVGIGVARRETGGILTQVPGGFGNVACSDN